MITKATFQRSKSECVYYMDFDVLVDGKQLKNQYNLTGQELTKLLDRERKGKRKPQDALMAAIARQMVKVAGEFGIQKDQIKWEDIEYSIEKI